MRDGTKLKILQALLHQPGVSRADLSERVGLSRATVTTLLQELELAGIVQRQTDEGLERRRTIGRPPLHVSLAPSAAYAVGVDLAGDHVRAAVCDLGGRIVAGAQTAVDPDDEVDVMLESAVEVTRIALAEAAVNPAKVLGAGVGVAAPVDADRGTIHAAGVLPRWRELGLREALERRLGIPVRIDNDANACAIGEALFGAGRGARQLAVVRLSSCVGLGLILDDRPFRGACGVAGELGHVRVARDGLICRCGGRGCLETVASSRAIRSQLERSAGGPVTLEQLFELVATGQRAACRAVADAGEAVGEAIATTVNLLNPERVVVGGELAAAGDVLLEPIRKAIARQAIAPAAAVVKVVSGELGERAAVLGAAAIQLAQAPYALAEVEPLATA